MFVVRLVVFRAAHRARYGTTFVERRGTHYAWIAQCFAFFAARRQAKVASKSGGLRLDFYLAKNVQLSASIV